MVIELDSPSSRRTFAIGRELGTTLAGREIVLLHGGLGAGKTLFTQGLASGMGLDPDDIVSPTFTLMNVHRRPVSSADSSESSPPHDVTLLHVDCYRLGLEESRDSRRLILPELDEWLGSAVIVVEWAQYLDPSYDDLEGAIRVDLQVRGEERRRIRIEGSLSERAAQALRGVVDK